MTRPKLPPRPPVVVPAGRYYCTHCQKPFVLQKSRRIDFDRPAKTRPWPRCRKCDRASGVVTEAGTPVKEMAVWRPTSPTPPPAPNVVATPLEVPPATSINTPAGSSTSCATFWPAPDSGSESGLPPLDNVYTVADASPLPSIAGASAPAAPGAAPPSPVPPASAATWSGMLRGVAAFVIPLYERFDIDTTPLRIEWDEQGRALAEYAQRHPEVAAKLEQVDIVGVALICLAPFLAPLMTYAFQRYMPRKDIPAEPQPAPAPEPMPVME